MNFEFLKSYISNMLRGDKVLWLVATIMALFSVLIVYSSSEGLAYRYGSASESFLARHAILLGGAIFLMYVCHVVDYMRYARFSTYLLVIAVISLVYTQLFGATLNQASRWVRIPFVGITVQTSDFAKVALIMYVARTLAMMAKREVSMTELAMPVLLVCGLIAPSDLSTAGILFFTCLLLMFIGKVELRNVASVLMLGIGAFAVLIALSDYIPAIRADTWVNRLKDFSNGGAAVEEETYQVLQAKMAIAQGGFLGVGPGNGVQSHFLPHAYSDYIYCIIVEEYGLLGAFGVLTLYMILLIRCIRLVTRSPKAFGAMLAIGLCLMMVVQAFTHMAVNVNLLPVTGLTLPFISMGGTSLMFTGISLGIILSVSKSIESGAEEAEE
jgi:cell division protein FtsW